MKNWTVEELMAELEKYPPYYLIVLEHDASGEKSYECEIIEDASVQEVVFVH